MRLVFVVSMVLLAAFAMLPTHVMSETPHTIGQIYCPDGAELQITIVVDGRVISDETWSEVGREGSYYVDRTIRRQCSGEDHRAHFQYWHQPGELPDPNIDKILRVPYCKSHYYAIYSCSASPCQPTTASFTASAWDVRQSPPADIQDSKCVAEATDPAAYNANCGRTPYSYTSADPPLVSVTASAVLSSQGQDVYFLGWLYHGQIVERRTLMIEQPINPCDGAIALYGNKPKCEAPYCICLNCDSTFKRPSPNDLKIDWSRFWDLRDLIKKYPSGGLPNPPIIGRKMEIGYYPVVIDNIRELEVTNADAKIGKKAGFTIAERNENLSELVLFSKSTGDILAASSGKKKGAGSVKVTGAILARYGLDDLGLLVIPSSMSYKKGWQALDIKATVMAP